jgi:hypothetical protein
MSDFWTTLPPRFLDPVTGRAPTNERELSALLAFFHQRASIAWDRVALYEPGRDEPVRRADSLFRPGGVLLTEYPLFAKAQDEIHVWGAMPADLLYLSSDTTTVVLIENKVGSRFTSGGRHLEHGQLARQAEYLRRGPTPHPYLVLLSTTDCLRRLRYGDTLRETLVHNQRHKRVTGYVMRWEDVFESLMDAV